MKPLKGLTIGAGLAFLMLATVTAHAQTQPAPAAPQPDAATLKDGLAVRYYFAKLNHIDELVGWTKMEDGVAGTPLPMLDYEDSQGNVLTTTSNTLVGAHITGFIEFAEPGTYRLQVISNDGVRVTLGGAMIFEDPGVHKAEASPDLVFDVAGPGWYPLDILYFQKKGTWTLQLRWQPPGAPGFVPVPGASLKHP